MGKTNLVSMLTPLLSICARVSELGKEAALRAVVPNGIRGFKSHPSRHIVIVFEFYVL